MKRTQAEIQKNEKDREEKYIGQCSRYQKKENKEQIIRQKRKGELGEIKMRHNKGGKERWKIDSTCMNIV